MFKRSPRGLYRWLCEDKLNVCGGETGYNSEETVIKRTNVDTASEPEL